MIAIYNGLATLDQFSLLFARVLYSWGLQYFNLGGDVKTVKAVKDVKTCMFDGCIHDCKSYAVKNKFKLLGVRVY